LEGGRAPSAGRRLLDPNDALSASARSLVSEGGQSGITMVSGGVEGASVSSVPSGSVSVHERNFQFSPSSSQRVSLRQYQDANKLITYGSLRGGLGSPRSLYERPMQQVANAMQPKVVPLISRLSSGASNALSLSQEFASGTEGFLRERTDPLPGCSPAVAARGQVISQGQSLSDRGALLWTGNHNHASVPAMFTQPSVARMQMAPVLGESVTSPFDLKSKSLTLPVGTAGAYSTGVASPVQLISKITTEEYHKATLRPVRQESTMENGRGRSPMRLPQTPRGQIPRADYIELTPRTARPSATFTPQSALPGVRMGLCTSR